MKLIFCRNCKTITSLHTDERTCLCGKGGGSYREDGLHADIWGDVIPLGVDDRSFNVTLEYFENSGKGVSFNAFVISKDCHIVHRSQQITAEGSE